MRRAWISSSWMALALGLVGASCSGTPEGNVSVVTGDETDAFSRTPAPVTLVAEKVAADGNKTEITRAQLPVDTINLGDLPRADVGAIAITAVDAAGKVLLRGETLLLQWGAIEGTTLEVFVQRTNELARMPSGPAATDATDATMVVGRYVLAASGTTGTLYDLLGLRTLALPTPLPRPAKSMATVGTAVLLIDEAGATTFDLSDASTFQLAAPPGGNFAEVAGGYRVDASDGSQFVVGGTRFSGGATPRILTLDSNGKATFVSLSAAREGACATWVDGRGLVVVAGNGGAPGAEILGPTAAAATPLPFPPDGTHGCAATTLDGTHVLIVGGTGAPGDTGAAGMPARVLDLGCATNCALAPWPDPIPLARAQAFALAPDAAFVVGDDGAGATHAFRASATPGATHEVSLHVPRHGARLVATPTGSFTIIGGGVGIEQYLE